MIRPANSVGEFSPANSGAINRTADTNASGDANPSDLVSINGQAGGVKGDDSATTSSKPASRSRSGKSHSSKPHSSHGSAKTSAAKGPQPSKFEKATEKFFGSLVELQGCGPTDQLAAENAIVATQHMDKLDNTQKLFVMAQGMGQYAVGELGKMMKSPPDQASAQTQDKRWNTLTKVVKTANEMVKTYPTTNSPVPTVADFDSGAPGSLLGNTPAPAPTPAGESSTSGSTTTTSTPTPPVDPDQAAKDDYNSAMKIYQDIVAARQKNLADLMKIQEDTQTAIQASLSNIWAGWAKVFQDGIDLFNRYLRYGGDPKSW